MELHDRYLRSDLKLVVLSLSIIQCLVDKLWPGLWLVMLETQLSATIRSALNRLSGIARSAIAKYFQSGRSYAIDHAMQYWQLWYNNVTYTTIQT